MKVEETVNERVNEKVNEKVNGRQHQVSLKLLFVV